MTSLLLAAAAAQWTALVAVPDVQRGVARVELKLRGLPDGQTSLCFGRSLAARFAGGLPRDPSDRDCLLAESKQGLLEAGYQLDLRGLGRSSGDPDDCSAAPSG